MPAPAIWSRISATAYPLLVLALTFLNFGHTSAVFAAGGRVVVTGHSICGEQPAQRDGDHFACHACRPDNVALPPPPLGVAPVCFAMSSVRYDDAVDPVSTGMAGAPGGLAA